MYYLLHLYNSVHCTAFIVSKRLRFKEIYLQQLPQLPFVSVSHSDTQQQHSALPLSQSNKELFCCGFEEHAADNKLRVSANLRKLCKLGVSAN